MQIGDNLNLCIFRCYIIKQHFRSKIFQKRVQYYETHNNHNNHNNTIYQKSSNFLI